MNRSNIIDLIRSDPDYASLADKKDVDGIIAKLNEKTVKRENTDYIKIDALTKVIGDADATKVMDVLREEFKPDFAVNFADPKTQAALEKLLEPDVAAKAKEVGRKLYSIADDHGGEASQNDVTDAFDIISRAPLHAEAQQRLAIVNGAIDSGEVRTSDEMISKFAESLPK